MRSVLLTKCAYDCGENAKSQLMFQCSTQMRTHGGSRDSLLYIVYSLVGGHAASAALANCGPPSQHSAAGVPFMKGFLRQFLWTLPLGVAVHDVIGSVIRIDGRSMQPTLNAPGADMPEWVLVEKVSVKLKHEYERGGVYVFW